MKKLFLFLLLFSCLGFTDTPLCSDGIVYANADQAGHDVRFTAYPKIEGIPKYKGGDKKLDRLIRSNLKLADEAKTQYFSLNYMLIVNCDGTIKEVKPVGDPRTDNWTNIKAILEGTAGNWKPAKKDGKKVDCIYFRSLYIDGANIKKKIKTED